MTRAIAYLSIFLALLALPTSTIARCITDISTFEPDRVEIPGTLESEQAIEAVARAFVMRGWRVTEVDRTDMFIDAELPVRQHVARVRARADTGAVTFHYRKSDNLPHGWEVDSSVASSSSCRELVDERPSPDAPELVHPNYSVWVDQVSRTVEGTLMLAGFSRDN